MNSTSADTAYAVWLELERHEPDLMAGANMISFPLTAERLNAALVKDAQDWGGSAYKEYV